ncbi:MAG TPA: chemotaxis protein CheD [Longimicrobiales bacterium]
MSDEQRVHVKIGEIKVARSCGQLYTIGLGSCIAVALYDAKERIAGLAHVMLPAPTSRVQTPGRAAPTAIPEMLRIMEAAGARRRGMYARIAGGAAMFESVLPTEGLRLGERNIEAVRAALRAAGIPLRAEDVGGTFGRSVYFEAADGRILVRAVKRDDVIL